MRPARSILGFEHLEGGPGRGHGQRLPPEGAAVVPRPESRSHLAAGPARTDRHPVAQRLGHGHHVRLDVEVLEAEPPAGSPEARLDLVDHEQDAPVGAELAQGAEVIRRRHHHTGFAHDRLDEDGGHSGRIAGRLQRRKIVIGHVVEAVGHGKEGRLLFRLPGGGEGAEGPAVEGVPRSHHREPTRGRPTGGRA